jgi:S-adenosylmethionine:tRNA ribosyltransferase-isomerase
VRTSAYDYDLPEAAVAQVPAEPRDAARLLVDRGPAAGPLHRHVSDLPELVGPGDLIVVNETRVLPARLRLRKATGGEVEVLLLEPVEDAPVAGASEWEALVRPGRRVVPGTRLLAGGTEVVEVGEHLEGGRRRVRLLAGDAEGALANHGVVPLPPYIHRPLDDPERYQTVYSRRPGSVAAPTAGLHLTPAVLDRCLERGAELARVDLAVGLDTFRPIVTEAVEDHEIHSERYAVPAETLEACARAGRVIAVGTTTVRALESAARGAPEGRTRLFIRPGFEFRTVDVLLTNFHLPRSSLLCLVAAFVGERWRDLYGAALDEGYRFLSFGDAMLLSRATGAAGGDR